MEETVGMTIAMNEVLQDASRSGNALKSISVNLAGMKASAKDGTLSLNKTAMALKEIAGIEVLNEQTGEIKDMYQVMEELYGKWGRLNEQQRAGLAEAIAGKTQQNAFQALMNNWEKARQLVDDYNNGLTIGSAQKENLAFLDSIQGKWNAIKENLKSVANSIVTSEFAKGFLDVIEKITDKIADFAKTDFGKIAIPFTIIASTLTPLIGLLTKLSGVGKLTSALTGIASTAGGVSATATAIGSIGTSASGSVGLIGTLAGALGGVSACTAGLVAVGVAVAGIGIAVGDSTSALSYLQRELGLIGTAISGLCEVINGAFQLTFGTLWENIKGIGKGLVALFTGDWSSIDDIFMETMANVRTNINEAMSDIGMSTTRGLKTMQNLTREELSGVTSIFENEFKNLPKLTREGVDETSKIFAEKISTMSGEQINVMRGMGGEIGSTLFQGIHEGMGEVAMEGQFSKNLITLLQSGLLDSGEIEKLISTYNSQLEKCVKDSSSNFKQAGTDMFNQMKEGLTSGNWKDALGDISSDIDSWSNEMLDKQRSFGEEWATLLDGVTEDMSKNEMFQKMYDNIDEFIEGGKMEEFIDGLRKSQQEAHKVINEMAEDVGEGAKKTKEELQSTYESLDIDTRVKLKTEFEGIEETQLTNIHAILEQFPKEIQTKLKGEGYKEFLSEAENVQDLIEKLPKEKLIELIQNTQFVGSLTPQELQTALEKLPDEKVAELLVQTKFLNNLTPEQLADALNTLPEEKRIDVIQTLIENGKRTPEQLAEALATLPDKKIAELILEMKESGKYTPEKIQEIIEYLPTEVRTVVSALIEGYDSVEQFKGDIEEIPTDNTVRIKVEGINTDKPKEIKENIKEIPTDTNSNINVTETNSELINKTLEMLGGLPEEENVNVNVKENDKSGLEAIKELEKAPNEKNIIVKIAEGAGNLLGGIGDWIKSKATKNEQTVTIKAKVGEVDTSMITNIKVSPIEINANTSNASMQIEALKSSISGLETKPIFITANTSSALSQINTLKSSVDNIQSKIVNITANVIGTTQINTLKTVINSLQSKAINVSVSTIGTNNITALKSAIDSLQGKTVTVNVIAEGATGIAKLISSIAGVNAKQVTVVAKVTGTNQVNALTSAINKVKSKSVKITASVSGTSAVNSLASAIANVRSKTVRVNVNKSVRTTTQAVGASVSEASYTPTPMSLLTSDIVSASNGIAPINVPVTASATKNSLFDSKNILPSIDFDIDMFKNLEEALKNLVAQLDVIDKKIDGAFGKEKVDLLLQQIPLLKQQQVIQEKIIQGQREQNSELSKQLKNQGFTFNNLGEITNYNDKLLAMEKNVESLKKKYDDLNNAKNKNESAISSAQKAYDSANETLNKTKNYLNEYFETNSTAVLEATTKWYEYENEIRDVQQAVIDLQNEFKELNIDSGYKNIERDITELKNKLDMNEILSENVGSREEIEYLEQKVTLIEQLQKETKDLLDYEKELRNELMSELNEYSFEFRDDGSIVNYGGIIADLKKTLSEEEFSDVFEKIELYLEKTTETIPDLQEEYEEFNNEIKDSVENIRDLQKELRELNIDSGYKNVERDIAEVQNKLDMNDILLDRTEGEESIKILEERIELIQQLQKETKDLENYERQLRSGLMSELSQYGFSFRDDGSIVGYSQKIEELKKSLSEEEFDNVFEKIEEYVKKTTETIPNLVLEYEKFNNEILDSKENIKDVYEELAKAEEEARKEAQRLAREIEKVRVDSLYDTYKNRLTNIQGELDVIDAELNKANGIERIDLLREQISLTEKLKKETQSMLDFQNSRRNTLMGELSRYGIGFANDGSIAGLSEAMASLRRSLDDDDFNAINEKVQEYLNLCESIPGVEADWVSLNDIIADCRDEIEELNREVALLGIDTQLQTLTYEFEKLETELDIINNKIEFAYGIDKINLMKSSVELMNQQLEIQSDIIGRTQKKMEIYQNSLKNYGFNFDKGGNIANLDDQLRWFNNTDDFEKVNSLVEEYFNAQEEIRNVIKDYSDLEKAIKDAYDQQLDITKEVEDKITDVIKKEHEKRKKEIEDYTDARVKLLKEEQETYQKMRDEQDYEKTMQNQLDEVEALRRQIEIAKRDTSVSGEKRLVELTKELAEAEKELAEVTQNKIDKDYENNIDSEIEKLEKEQDLLLKSLEEQFSEVNIGKMVVSALTTGIIEINGEVQTLQDTLINSINDSVEGYSVMSNVIKNELVSNLNVALETMKQIENIGEVLGLQNYNVLSSSSIELVGAPSYNGSGHTITVGDTHLVINGSVSDDVISDIEELINQKNNEMLNKITSSL